MAGSPITTTVCANEKDDKTPLLMCCSEKDDTIGVKANGIMIKVKGMNKAGNGDIGDSYNTGDSSDEDT